MCCGWGGKVSSTVTDLLWGLGKQFLPPFLHSFRSKLSRSLFPPTSVRAHLLWPANGKRHEKTILPNILRRAAAQY